MRQHVAAAHEESGPVLEEAATLLMQKQDLETKRQLLDAFNKHFIMSEEDLMVLTTTTDTVDDRFFAVLKRVKQIYTDCQILFGTENQRLGLELMDQSSRNLNSGFQKLYRWIQHEFKSLNLENPQISSIIRQALRTLAERPTLFESCLDFFAEAREHVLTEAFYSALTGSSSDAGHDPLTKPIEFSAHDPLRYVGDMLAWTHSATVSEREALESLFVSDGHEIAKGIQAGRDSEPWSAFDSGTFDGRKALGQLVNRNLAGVARGLRQRIEQVVQSHNDPVLTYKIANLLDFYRIMFQKLLGKDSSVLETLLTLKDFALGQFQTIMKDQANSVQADLAHPPPDLRIPDFLDEALNLLQALMKSYDSSLAPASSRESDFQPILDQALTPFLDICEKLAKQAQDPAQSIFFANCLLAAKRALSPYNFVHNQISLLNETLATCTSTLTDYQHAFFLHTSGLHPLVAALAPLDSTPASSTKILTLPPFQPDALKTTSQILDDFLPSALMDAMENLKGLSSAKVAGEITAEAAERFCEDFEFVEGRLGEVDERRFGDSDGGEEGGEEREGVGLLREVFPRTTGEIRVLLS